MKYLKIVMTRKMLIKLSKNQQLSEFALTQMLQQLEAEASRLTIKKVKLAKNDNIFTYLSGESFKKMANKNLKNLKIILFEEPEIIKSPEKIVEILKFYHDSPIGGHTGVTRMIKRIREKYNIKNIRKTVLEYVKNCEKCKINKHTIKVKAPLQVTSTPAEAFDTVAIDTIGPFTRSNRSNRYAITIQDELTKFVEIIPISCKEAAIVARAIVENFILTYGIMKNIKTDLGTEYVNYIFKEVCKILEIEHTTSTAYHPMTIGALERNHKCLNEYLRSYINENQDDWDIWSQYYKFCYNITPNDHGYAPFNLVFGRRANLPTDLVTRKQPINNIDNYSSELHFRLKTAYEQTNKKLIQIKNKTKDKYDANINDIIINIDDLVYLQKENRTKLDKVYEGPFVVTKIIGLNLELKDKNNKSKLVHRNRVVKK